MIEFKDTCIVRRDTSMKDEWDNVRKEVVYEGRCLYQERSSTMIADSMVIRNPLLFIPTLEVEFRTNDSIEITTSRGRRIDASIEVCREVELRDLSLTRVELKLGKGL